MPPTDPATLGLLAGSLAVRLFVATVLLFAASHKLRNPLEFEGILGQYRLTPGSINPGLSRLVPALEITCACALLLIPVTGAILAITLLGGYAAAIGVNLQRGRHHIDCGCGGESTPLSPGLVFRNLTLMVLLTSVVVADGVSATAASMAQLSLSVAFAFGMGALYISYNQLQVNAGIYRRLWLGERVG